MIGSGKLGTGVKVLYRDKEMNDPYPNVSTQQPQVKILDECNGAYKVDVDSPHFDPTTVWIAKSDVIGVYISKPPEQVKPVIIQGLQTGDIMQVRDKDGKLIGEWEFTKY